MIQSKYFKLFVTRSAASFFVIAAAFLLFSNALAQPAESSLREQAAEVIEFDVNGLKVLVKSRPSASTVSAGLFIRGGARNITAETAGQEILMLEAATEASRKYPRETLRRILASKGTAIGSGINNDYSVLSLASTKENFAESWKIFSDIAMYPKFDASDIERVKEQRLTGLREAETDNDNFLEILEERIVFKGHPYSVDVGGTIQTIPKFTAKDLRDLHGQLMQTSRLLLVVVGNVDADVLKGMIENTLGNLPRGDYKPAPVPEIVIAKPAIDIVRRPLPTNYVQGVFNAPGLDNPDYYPMKIAMALLQARVFQSVRVDRQLSYAPNAEMNTDAANTAKIYVTTVSPNEAVRVMLDDMDELKNFSVDPGLIDSISGHFLTLHYIDLETNAAQARDLATYEMYGGGWRKSFEFLDRIKAVTPGQIQAVAKKYFKNIHFVVIGDPALIDKAVFLGEG
jgi:predicted Zn-dependent peptidase